MRQHYHLRGHVPTALDSRQSTLAAETVLAIERVVETNNLVSLVWVAEKLSQKEGECERAFVSGTKRVAKARAIKRRDTIAELHRSIVDRDLVGRARNTASIPMCCIRNAKTRIEVH